MDNIDKLIEEKDDLNGVIKSTLLIHNLTKEEFNLKSRERRLIDARRMAYAICKDLLNFGWSRIGKEFGMNHASIIHHYNQHLSFLKTDSFYLSKYESLLEVAKCEIGFVEIENIIEEAKKINQQRIEERLNIKNKVKEL